MGCGFLFAFFVFVSHPRKEILDSVYFTYHSTKTTDTFFFLLGTCCTFDSLCDGIIFKMLYVILT